MKAPTRDEWKLAAIWTAISLFNSASFALIFGSFQPFLIFPLVPLVAVPMTLAISRHFDKKRTAAQ